MQRRRFNSQPVTDAEVSRIVWHFGLFSLAALLFAFPLAHVTWLPGWLGAIGCVPAFVGAGTGMWAAERLRSFRVFRATLPALFAVVGWFVFALWYIG